jgi:hypothetical protein
MLSDNQQPGKPLSAQDNRRLTRALVCGALLVYGCLRIPAAAQPVDPRSAQLHQLQNDLRDLAAPGAGQG